MLQAGFTVLAFLLGTASGAHAATGVIKLGLDAAGQQEITISNTSLSETFDTDAGVSLALEVEGHLHRNFDLGFGLEVQFPRKLTNSEGEFAFLPIYLLVKLHPEMSDVTPYFIGQLGLALFNADERYRGAGGETQAGGHVGIGGGLVLNNRFQFELLLTADSGQVTYPYPLGVLNRDVVYSKMTLSAGFRF
jgi:hypothetical protein